MLCIIRTTFFTPIISIFAKFTCTGMKYRDQCQTGIMEGNRNGILHQLDFFGSCFGELISLDELLPKFVDAGGITTMFPKVKLVFVVYFIL